MFKWITVLSLLLAAPLSAEVKVVAFSGSTREGSLNKKLLREATSIAKQMGANVTVIDLKDFPMPFYDGDLEARQGMPETARRLRNLLIGSNAVIIATPEYNASISAVLKNAIDWMSRDDAANPSRDAFKGKKFAIMSASPGKGGGARALVDLRKIISNAGGEVITLQVTVPNADKAFNGTGELQDPTLKQNLRDEIQQLLR